MLATLEQLGFHRHTLYAVHVGYMHGVAAHIHHSGAAGAALRLIGGDAGALAAIHAVGLRLAEAHGWRLHAAIAALLHHCAFGGAFLLHFHILSRGFAKVHKGAEQHYCHTAHYAPLIHYVSHYSRNRLIVYYINTSARKAPLVDAFLSAFIPLLVCQRYELNSQVLHHS